jgi:hypothetical protein
MEVAGASFCEEGEGDRAGGGSGRVNTTAAERACDVSPFLPQYRQ